MHKGECIYLMHVVFHKACLTSFPMSLGVPNQPHIVEFHGLNRGVKTSHLDEFLLDYMWGGTTANIKWVDDEHALAVFPCAEAAQQLLDSTQIRYKVRPYSKASGGALQISAEGEIHVGLSSSDATGLHACHSTLSVFAVWCFAICILACHLTSGSVYLSQQCAPALHHMLPCWQLLPFACYRTDSTSLSEA